MQVETKLNGISDSIKAKGEGIKAQTVAWIESEIDSAKKMGAKSLEDVRTLTNSTFDSASSEFSVLAKKSRQFIQKNPVVSVAAVMLTGYAIARVLRLRITHENQSH